MTRRRWRAAGLAGGFGILVAGLLLASNQGFGLNFALLGPANSASGTNWIALPYHTPANLQTASDLFTSLGGTTNVTSVSRFLPATATYQVYTGGPGNNFNLVPGEGIRLVMKVTMSYRMLGSHDPTRVLTLLGAPAAQNGMNWYAHPYNAKAKTAAALRNEIGGQNATSVARFLPASDSLIVYSGLPTDQSFTLLAGEAYLLTMTRTLQFVPQTRP